MFSYEVLQSLNDLEMLVYSYIMEHKEEVQYMTIRELSQAVHVSTSTVIRFCKKAGCDGYSEFRVDVYKRQVMGLSLQLKITRIQ